MNRIKEKLQENKKLLSIYFTAGYPALNNTVQIIQDLEKNGVDMIEIGLPFSDPLAKEVRYVRKTFVHLT
jgi:tryptophan synthase alpha chain